MSISILIFCAPDLISYLQLTPSASPVTLPEMPITPHHVTQPQHSSQRAGVGGVMLTGAVSTDHMAASFRADVRQIIVNPPFLGLSLSLNLWDQLIIA